MKKTKVISAKRSFFMSVLSLVLCFAMLLGTTWAWFTDEVTSGTNKIIAGNLDIEVSYKPENSSEWVSIKDVGTLFSNNLWEPGHTEYVTLKIENKGTLALKYQLNVSPVSESGGINKAGESFKLSDYLVFGTATSSTEPTYNDRTAARNAVSTTMKLNQAGLSKSSTLLAKAANVNDNPAEYITLVVYMPDTVGNEANYKTGTTAPTIDLGIKVIATQIDNENDSFGDNYDAGAFDTMDKTIAYNYFPKVSMAGQVVVGTGSTVAKGTTAGNEVKVEVEANTNTVTVYSDAASDHTNTIASVSVPVQPKSDANVGDTGTVKLEVNKMDAPSETATNIAVNEGQEVTSYDIKAIIDGKIEKASGGLFTVKMNIGAGKSGLTLTHIHGTEQTSMTPAENADAVNADNKYYYDINTGVLTLAVTEFSEFATVYNKAVAAIGTTAYGSLADAIAAVHDNETIVMLKDCTGNGISVNLNKTFTVDFNGTTYTAEEPLAGSTGTKNQAFQLIKGSTITFRNGTLTSAVAMILIQNYADLTLENMTLNGANLQGNKAVLSINNGDVKLNNTTITAKTGGTALDVSWWPQSYASGAQVTLNSGTINGNVTLGIWGPLTDAQYTDVKSKLTINGGSINGIVKEDYVTDESSQYKVDEAKVVGVLKQMLAVNNGATVTVESEKMLKAALATANNATVKLANDVSVTESGYADSAVTVSGENITLDMNGKTLTNANAKNGVRMLSVGSNATLTVTGNGRFVAGEGSFCGDNSFLIINDNGGSLVVNSGYFEGANACIGTVGPNSKTTINNAEVKALAGSACLWVFNGGVLDVYGMTFYGIKNDTEGCGCIWAGYKSTSCTNGGGTANVYGGTYTSYPMNKEELKPGEINGSNYCLYDYYDATSFGYTMGTINVYGGTFINFDPSGEGNTPNTSNYDHNYVPTGYHAVQNDSTWTVVAE